MGAEWCGERPGQPVDQARDGIGHAVDEIAKPYLTTQAKWGAIRGRATRGTREMGRVHDDSGGRRKTHGRLTDNAVLDVVNRGLVATLIRDIRLERLATRGGERVGLGPI